MNNIINCKQIRDKYIEEIKKQNIKGCCVAFIQLGENPASTTYVRNKVKLCEEVGIEVEHYKLSENTTQEQLVATIQMLNKCSQIHGIMVQLPLPSHINEEAVINVIDPIKDIDGFTHVNKGKLMVGDSTGMIPCTPKGIMTIFKEENIDLKGKKVVIVGRSNIVGKPAGQLLINEGATVTVCNSSTPYKTLRELIMYSDIFISAIGKEEYFDINFFTDYGDWTMPYLGDTIAIDVGINRGSDGKLCGDISKYLYNEFNAATSVPGGVGIMTVLEVVRNSIECYKNQMIQKEA